MSTDRRAQYANIVEQLVALLEGERDMIANAANASALLCAQMDEINWVGFYFLRQNELVVGPFQGRPACVRIPLGKGVCGSAAMRRETIVVPDVHEFPGHIACDDASASEIVVPIIQQQRLIGVLDVDSPMRNRFDQTDREGLELVVSVFLHATDCIAALG